MPASSTDGICNLTQEDGLGLFVLEDGSGDLILEVCDEVAVGRAGWPGRRRTWDEIDDEIERKRPLTRTQWDKLKAAQKAAEEKVAELEHQNKHRQAEELARIAHETGEALLDAEAAEVDDAASLTALTAALNAAAGAKRITTQIHTANMQLAAFKAYLADIEDEDETILLLSL